jgi:hypothetical protein
VKSLSTILYDSDSSQARRAHVDPGQAAAAPAGGPTKSRRRKSEVHARVCPERT